MMLFTSVSSRSNKSRPGYQPHYLRESYIKGWV